MVRNNDYFLTDCLWSMPFQFILFPCDHTGYMYSYAKFYACSAKPSQDPSVAVSYQTPSHNNFYSIGRSEWSHEVLVPLCETKVNGYVFLQIIHTPDYRGEGSAASFPASGPGHGRSSLLFPYSSSFKHFRSSTKRGTIHTGYLKGCFLLGWFFRTETEIIVEHKSEGCVSWKRNFRQRNFEVDQVKKSD